MVERTIVVDCELKYVNDILSEIKLLNNKDKDTTKLNNELALIFQMLRDLDNKNIIMSNEEMKKYEEELLLSHQNNIMVIETTFNNEVSRLKTEINRLNTLLDSTRIQCINDVDRQYKHKIETMEFELQTKNQLINKQIEMIKQNEDIIEKRLKENTLNMEQVFEMDRNKLKHQNEMLQDKITMLETQLVSNEMNIKETLSVIHQSELKTIELKSQCELELLKKDLLTEQDKNKELQQQIEQNSGLLMKKIEEITENTSRRNKTTTDLGKSGEKMVMDILGTFYGHHHQYYKYEDCSGLPNKGDICLTVNRNDNCFRGCIDSKNYSNTIPSREITKLSKDVDNVDNNYSFGIMISIQDIGFANNKENFEIITTKKGKPIIFIKNVGEHNYFVPLAINMLLLEIEKNLICSNDKDRINKYNSFIAYIKKDITGNIKKLTTVKKSLEQVMESTHKQLEQVENMVSLFTS